jgi:hypothetical protein
VSTPALVVASALTTVALGVASQASAGPGISVSGTYSVADFGATTCVPVDSSSFMFRCDTSGLVSQYSGDLSGTAVADFTSLINCKTGRETGHGTETFTGSISDVGVGTLTYIDQFSADVDCSFAPDFFIPFNLDINSVAVKGPDDFAGLQGTLTFTDTSFSGTLH